MNKIIKISAAVIAAGMAVTVAGCSGCSGSGKNTTLTSSNWYTGTSYRGIQPSFIASDPDYADYAEKIFYDVTFEKPAGSGNLTYSVDYYENGVMSTEFYATYYDWNTSCESYSTDENELVYYYKTVFNISGRFTMKNSGAYKDFDDSVVNECYFRAAGKNLQPVYSRQTISSTSPANYQASKIEDAYTEIAVEYENFYNFNCTEVTTVTTQNGEKSTKTTGLSKISNSVFDNSSLYIALRSMKLSDSLSQAISLYSPAQGGVSTYTVTGSNADIGNKKAEISEELADNGLYVPVTKDANGNDIEDAGIATVAVDINYAGGPLQGTTQTVWYAAIESPDNNTARTTMLKISVPLSYGLGTLNFTLNEIQSTLWND